MQKDYKIKVVKSFASNEHGLPMPSQYSGIDILE